MFLAVAKPCATSGPGRSPEEKDEQKCIRSKEGMEAQPAAVCQAREKCQIPPLQIQSRSKLLRGTCWSRAHDADRIEEVVLKVLHVSLQKGLPSYLHMQMTKTEESWPFMSLR